jgi:uncharacterized membrane protein YccC
MNISLRSFLKQNHPVALITAIKMCTAGLLGFLLIYFLHLPESVWCLITIAAVLQTGLNQTLAKSFMRAIGTILGAVIGYWIALYTNTSPGFIVLLLIFIMIFCTSCIALQPTIYSYAGIVTGMTITIIIFFGLAHEDILTVAVDRTIEVLLGILILAVLNIVLFFIVKKFFPRGISKSVISWQLPKCKMEKQYVFSALKVASACVLTFLIWFIFKQPQGYWATITCLLIMEENQKETLKKGLFRFLSHLIAAVIGLGFTAAFLHAPYAWRLLPLLLTFFVCGFLIGTKNQYASMGNTLGIAIAIMLFSSPGTQETFQIIFARFYNVVIGVSVAFLMLFSFTSVKPSSHKN